MEDGYWQECGLARKLPFGLPMTDTTRRPAFEFLYIVRQFSAHTHFIMRSHDIEIFTVKSSPYA